MPVATRLGGEGTVLASPNLPLRSVPVWVLLLFDAVRGNPAGAEATEDVVLISSMSLSPPSLRMVDAKEAFRDEASDRAKTDARWYSITSRRRAMCCIALLQEVCGCVRYSRYASTLALSSSDANFTPV